jgi:uncharacterized repeat protein (TIGR02543 family)
MQGIFSRKFIRYSLAIVISLTMFFSCTFSAFAGGIATGAESGSNSVITAEGAGVIPAVGSSGVIPADVGISADDNAALASVTKEPEPGTEFDGYIVRLDDSKAAQKKIDTDVAEEVTEDIIAKDIMVVNEPEDVLEFADPSAVEIIEPNYMISALDFPADAPDDTYYSEQWHLPKIGASSFWQATPDLRGDGITVAIIDSGLNMTHRDIDQAKVTGRNYTAAFSSDPANYSDEYGHGSFVTGLIAGQINNGTDIAGITDQVNLEIMKVMRQSTGGYIVDFIEALNDLNNGTNGIVIPDVINMSLGWEAYNDTANVLIQSLISKGVIVVAAVGNSGDSMRMYPAAYTGVIGVGATDDKDVTAYYSNRNSTVDVSAPGSSMTSLWCGSDDAYVGGPSYSGTSYAAPLVTATAAALKDYADDNNILMNDSMFLSILTKTSVDLGSFGKDTSYGVGRLSCSGIVDYLNGISPGGNLFDITITLNANCEGAIDAGCLYRNIGDDYKDLPDLIREGYIFDGWFTEAIGGAQVFTNLIVKPESHTLYAHWTRLSYTAKFDANGGKVSKTQITKLYFDPIGTLPKATRVGYKFLGWYTDSSGGYKINASEKVTKDITYYAQWKSKSYKVKFNSRGGNVTYSTTVLNGAPIGTLFTPKRSGYKFLGWFTKASGGKKISIATKVKANATYYAHWARKYTVKWNANKGKVKKTSTSIAKGSKVGKLQKPTRSGYKFLGWYTKKSGGTKISKSTMIKGSKTYYAHWKKRK